MDCIKYVFNSLASSSVLVDITLLYVKFLYFSTVV